VAADEWPDAVCAVVAVPDARKGERLILYTQKKDATRGDLIALVRARHLSELMIPAEVIYMEKLPMLGSGKVDLLTLQKMAKERAEQAQRRPTVPA
jgi:acyl-[acyl-carrier-protein]-phospholipid O-acyltransferase/long-chain-fatty-acid--[acyl-carrier-protein] ligase